MRMLCLAAHPDDEILWFWPYVLNRPAGFSLVVCSSDENNKNREWCKQRRQALAEVCSLLQLNHYCLPFPSEFSKLPHRGVAVGLNEVADEIIRVIKDIAPTEILTHNPHGEYGHQDHRFLHQLVVENLSVDLYFTDIYQSINWPLGSQERVITPHRGYINCAKRVKMTDEQKTLYQQCKQIYLRHNCWTWSLDVVEECAIFQVSL